MIGPGEADGGAGIGFGLDPDAAAAGFDDPFDEGEAEAGTGDIGVLVESLEDLEDLVAIALGDTGSVIGDGELIGAGFAQGGNADQALGFVEVFDGVIEEVLEDLVEPFGVAVDDGEVFVNGEGDVGGWGDDGDDLFDQFAGGDAGLGFG